MSDRSIDRRDVLKAAATTGVAAVGLAGNASARDLPHTITIEARGEFVEYSFEVTGGIERGPEADDGDEVVDDGRVEAAVTDHGSDDYRFSGEITEFDADGPVTVFVDGERVRDLVGQAKVDLPHTITIGARGEHVEYSFEVSGRVEEGPDVDDGEGVVGHHGADGAVTDRGSDDYRFSGEITGFDADGPVTVSVDDEKVDPAELGKPDLPNEIRLKRLGDGAVEVRIEVDGEIAKAPDAGDASRIGDDSVAVARIPADRDSRIDFRFSGDVVAFEVLKGDVEVTFTVGTDH